MLLDEVIFLCSSRSIVGSPLFADKEVFKVSIIKLVLLNCFTVEVLNLQVRKADCQVHNAACD